MFTTFVDSIPAQRVLSVNCPPKVAIDTTSYIQCCEENVSRHYGDNGNRRNQRQVARLHSQHEYPTTRWTTSTNKKMTQSLLWQQ